MSLIQSTQTIVTTTAAAGAGVAEWMAALSTLGLVVFAAAQIEIARRHRNADERRAAQERADRAAAADARISVAAYKLRDEIQAWLDQPRATHIIHWAQELEKFLPGVTGRLAALLTEAEASPHVRDAVREAFVRYFRAAHLLRTALTRKVVDEKGQEVRRELETTVSLLNKVVDPALETTLKRVEAEAPK